MNNAVRLMMKYLEGQTLPAQELDLLVKSLYDEGLKIKGSIPHQAAQELGRDLDSGSVPAETIVVPKTEQNDKSKAVTGSTTKSMGLDPHRI